MNAPRELAALEQWLLATIADPAAIDTRAVCNRLTASRQQSPAERLAVYQRAYFARLLDVLRELFPCTRFAVGDEAFDELATGYVVRHPPHSYTLAHLADRFVDYLNETRPKDDCGLFVVELVKLEEAIDRIFDGPGPERLPPFALPPNATGELHLKLVPGCELHEFCFRVSTFYSDWKANREPPWPQPQQQHVALWRREYVVRRCELSSDQHSLLAAIARGESLAAALAETATRSPAPNNLAADLHHWFAAWSAAGLFVA